MNCGVYGRCKANIFSCGARFRFLSLATDTKFTAIRLSSKAACGLLSAGCSKEHPKLNIFTLRLCIQQFNIIYFINYTHIVGELAIKIFVMEEIMYMGTAARQASVPTD